MPWAGSSITSRRPKRRACHVHCTCTAWRGASAHTYRLHAAGTGTHQERGDTANARPRRRALIVAATSQGRRGHNAPPPTTPKPPTVAGTPPPDMGGRQVAFPLSVERAVLCPAVLRCAALPWPESSQIKSNQIKPSQSTQSTQSPQSTQGPGPAPSTPTCPIPPLSSPTPSGLLSLCTLFPLPPTPL